MDKTKWILIAVQDGIRFIGRARSEENEIIILDNVVMVSANSNLGDLARHPNAEAIGAWLNGVVIPARQLLFWTPAEDWSETIARYRENDAMRKSGVHG